MQKGSKIRTQVFEDDESGEELKQIDVEGVLPQVFAHGDETQSVQCMPNSSKQVSKVKRKRRVETEQQDLDMQKLLDDCNGYHNDYFQPSLYTIIANILVLITNPVYPVWCAFHALWSARVGCQSGKYWEGIADRLKSNDSLRVAVFDFGSSIYVNVSTIAWCLAGEDGRQIFATEVLLPRWLVLGTSLRIAAARDLHPKDWKDLVGQVNDYCDSRGPYSGCCRFAGNRERACAKGSPKEPVDEQSRDHVSIFSEHTLQRILIVLKVPKMQSVYFRVFESEIEYESMLLSERLCHLAHKSLLRHLRRIQAFPTELEMRIDPTDSTNPTEDIISKDFMSVYRTAFENKKMPLVVLAEQMLVGWPAVQKGPLHYIGIAARLLLILLSIALFVFGALFPGLLRRGGGGSFLPHNTWCKVVAVIFMLTLGQTGWLLGCVAPTQLQMLFSSMARSFRVLNSMLMGKRAAQAECVPYIRVCNIDDIVAWYELYALFIGSARRVKFPLEVGFAHNVLTVVGMSSLLVWHGIDPLWQPGVLFGATMVFFIAFLVFSVPPLLVGLRANMLGRETINLLWGHATESRAYLHKLERELGKAKTLGTKRELTAKIKEAKSAIDLTVDIAQRLRLDSALVIRTLGMELTMAQFTAIASLASTALIYAFNNRHVIEKKLEAFAF
ncbi:unnamed protein product [Durusdinium trenchii]|uniref:Uncharacterized protein n=2 Tax=Durusdinium trenchii TaxID=1381693 RepID=A0ABP0NEJ5_9DINO